MFDQYSVDKFDLWILFNILNMGFSPCLCMAAEGKSGEPPCNVASIAFSPTVKMPTRFYYYLFLIFFFFYYL